jgi:cytoskeletal protein CcmA (bactofilin family)
MAWNTKTPDSTPTPRPHTPSSVGERAVVGSSISVKGDLTGAEDLVILGHVEGKIDVASNTVTVGQGGRVHADVHGAVIVIEGEVEGDLYGTERAVLKASGKVKGNLHAPKISIEDGAQFEGTVDMNPVDRSRRSGGPKAPDAPKSAKSDDGSEVPTQKRAAG